MKDNHILYALYNPVDSTYFGNRVDQIGLFHSIKLAEECQNRYIEFTEIHKISVIDAGRI